MIVDLKKIGDYWHIGTIILSLVVSLTYFVIENKQANETISNLSETNKVLTEKVNRLEGQVDGFNHAIKTFMEHPPGLVEYRVEQLEKKVFGIETDEEENNTNITPPQIR